MEYLRISYYEAYLIVRDRHYITAPNAELVKNLLKWGAHRAFARGCMPSYSLCIYIFAVTPHSPSTWPLAAGLHFTCLCGATFFALKERFSTTYQQNPRPCSCSVKVKIVSCL